MEILNSYPVLEYRNNFFSMVSCVFFVAFLVLIIISFVDCEYKLSVVFTILIIISFISMLYYGDKVPSGRLEYQVILSNDYSAKELHEKYNVIKTEGKIWYIRDKEKNNENVDD